MQILFFFRCKEVDLNNKLYGCVLIQGGAIVLREVSAHWMDSLVASPNKKDMVFMHVKGPGLHFYAPTGNGGKYICAHQKLSANLTSVTSKRILLLRCTNIFCISTHFVEVCEGVLATKATKIFP